MTAQPWVKSYPPGVRWDAPLEISPVQAVLENAVAAYGDRPALQFMDRRLTYAELDAVADRAAAGFQKLGVGPGVHVGMLLPNTPHYVIAFFGVLKAGGIVVNYSPLDALPALEFKVGDSETDILVTVDAAAIYPQAERLLEFDPAENADRRRLFGVRRRAGAGEGGHGLAGHAGGGSSRRAPHRVPRPPRQRRPLREA